MLCNRFTIPSFCRGLCCTLGLLAWLANSATAAVITGETATASTVRGNGSFGGFYAAHVVDDSGLSAGSHSGSPPFGSLSPIDTMWLSHNGNVEAADTDPWLRIDLGAVYNITSFHVWNYNELFGGRDSGIQNVDIYYSTSNASVGTGDTSLGAFVFPNAGDTEDGTTHFTAGNDFSATLTARYIYLDINSNYGAAAYGLSEIQFTGTPTPEPSSMVLMALGGLFFGWRRWNRSVV